jgi:signal transduction histidine kinase
LQTGNIKPNLVKAKPSELIYEVKLLKEQMSKAKNIDLQSEINCDDFILADKEMIKTILRNLVSNAIKFTNREGRVKIETERFENNILFVVSDNGLGIAQEHLDKLFRIDSKLSKTGTADEKGSGLGLLLCKEFVEKNNGKIWVESELDKGSKFKFILPLFNN